jgi:hypothetical protein
MDFDLDRLERLAGGLAVLFYVLLFLAFITAIMGSGGGGLLLLVLGAVAHVGRVGLEDFVERRRRLGSAAAPEDDAGERATGLRLRWLPRELHFPRQLRLPRRIELGGERSRTSGPSAGRGEGTAGPTVSRGESAAAAVARSGEAVGVTLARAGAVLGSARADARASFAALLVEVREGPLDAAEDSFDLPRGGVENASSAERYDDDYAFVEGRHDRFEDADDTNDFEGADDAYEDFEDADDAYEDFELIAEPEPVPQPVIAAAPRGRAPSADAPTAQERYEARQRARAQRGEAEPIVAAVEAAETREPQRVQRRSPGGRPDPLRTRRPTRSF